eukprot:scaffold43845_cov33-Tisochrysis_lutea.AAC.1
MSWLGVLVRKSSESRGTNTNAQDFFVEAQCILLGTTDSQTDRGTEGEGEGQGRGTGEGEGGRGRGQATGAGAPGKLP